MMIHPWQQDQFFGNSKAEKYLFDLYNKDKLPNVMLLSGIKGIGKATLAYKLAKIILNCPTSLIRENENLLICDLYENDKQQILLEDIDKIRKFVNYTSVSKANHKIVIIDAIDDMNMQSQNALLKTLEDVVNAFFILIFHQISKVINPLLSRCCKIKMLYLVKSDLEKILDSLNLADAKKFISVGNGSISQVINLFNFKNYNNMLDIIGNNIKNIKSDNLFDFVQIVCSNQENYSNFCMLYNSFWHRIFCYLNGLSEDIILPAEHVIADLILKLNLQSYYFTYWLEARNILQNSINLNVNKMATVTYILNHRDIK